MFVSCDTSIFMKRLLGIILGLMAITVFASNQQTVSQSAKELDKAYQERNYELFFELFPSSFKTFIDYYGYTDKPMPLYSQGLDHVNYLFSDSLKIDEKYLNKLFAIAKDAVWEADAPNYFQNNLRDLILKYSQEIVSFLNKQDKKEIERFWYFVVYSLYPKELDNIAHYLKIRERIYPHSKEQSKIIEFAYKKVLEDDWE